MSPELTAAVQAALGHAIIGAQPLSGGDINDAYRVELDSGATHFVKANAAAPEGMFEAEADGLEWLAEARALQIPEVIAVGTADVAFVVLQHLAPAPRRPDFDDTLGSGLAALHRAGAPHFGHRRDNFIGTLPQDNTREADWTTFYWCRRLEPMLRRARDAGAMSRSLTSRFNRLQHVLHERVGPTETPARLHGDLWGGNLHTGPDGQPWLIDPAVYGGHREVDLSMMRLFGGFSSNVFRAYNEAFPLAPEFDERVPLYQLYPLLVHVNLFGGSYVDQASRALDQVL